MAQGEPKVSIVIPTYNEESNIGALLDDIGKLTYGNYEVIVSDDGSTDGTRVLLAAHDGIKVVLNEHGGRAQALNAGIQRAQGEFILQIGADCSLGSDDLIERMLERFDSTVAVWGAVEVGNSHDKFFPSLMRVAKKLNPKYLYGGACVMFRTDYIRSHPYSESSRGFSGEDFEVRERIPNDRQVYAQDAKVYANYPERLSDVLRQRFRYARSHVRLSHRKFSPIKILPVARDWFVMYSLLVFPIIGWLKLWSMVLALVLLFFTYRALKAHRTMKSAKFSALSVPAELGFVFVRSVGYLRELVR